MNLSILKWLVPVLLLLALMGIPATAHSEPQEHEVRLTLNSKIVKVIEINQPHFKLTKGLPLLQRSNLESPVIRPEKDSRKKVSNKVTTHHVTIYSRIADTRSVVKLAHRMVVAKWGESHWYAFYQIVNHESGWNPYAVNRSSGACGLFQALPCSKLGGMGIQNQLNWGIGYIAGRYNSPNQAWAFWQAHHWY